MKILYAWEHPNKKVRSFIEAGIKEKINVGYDITPINYNEELDIERPWSPYELSKLYHNKNKKLCKLYDKIKNLAKTHDVFIVNYGNVYAPEFVKSLEDIYTVLVSGDDPDSSDFYSKPYVHAFDHSFSWGVNFDDNTKITDKFLEWGAKRVNWWPYGFRSDQYDPKLTVEDICNKERDIDVAYVGSAYPEKALRLLRIKKEFPKMRIYGRGWGWKSLLRGSIRKISQVVKKKEFPGARSYGRNWGGGSTLTLIKEFGLIRELPMDRLVPLYQRSKIGINMHMSFGPSNVRLYQLPANGVMQICDCSEGLSQVFEIGKEVVTYHSIEEAIELIKYYLENDDERKKIASAGFKRVMKDYRRITTFSKAIEKIKKGMLEEGITHFKDGTPIIVDESG